MCCGRKRRQLHEPIYRPQPYSEPVPAPRPRRPLPAPVLFEYFGRTGLTARGAITGRSYRFSRPAARLAVDGRDAPSLAAVPNLRAVRA